MKKNVVVFSVSNNLTFAVAVVMINMRNKMPNVVDEVVILHDGITLKNQIFLSAIFPTRFILYNLPFDGISFIPDSILDYFTKMVFAKFECLKLLNEYKNVLFLDYDIVIQQDISELFDKCESGIKMMPSGSTVQAQIHKPVSYYNMNLPGICASTFVFQDHLKNYNEMYDFCYKNLVKYADVIYLPEQAIFEFMIQEFNLKIHPLSSQIYSPHPTDYALLEKAKIIHAYGQPKFWNGLKNEQWNNNYAKWIEMCGSKYKKPTIIDRGIKKIKKTWKRYV